MTLRGEWSLARLRFLPRDPALVSRLAARILLRVAARVKGLELIDWFVDDEAGELYIILSCDHDSLVSFLETVSAEFRGEGVWVSPLPTGTLGSWSATLRATVPGIESKVVVESKRGPLRAVHPDGVISELTPSEIAKCLVLAGLNMDDAIELAKETLTELSRDRNVVSLGELADYIVEKLSRRRAPARLLAAVRATLCPYLYVAFTRKGRLVPLTKQALLEELDSLLNRMELKPPPSFVERVVERAYDRVRLEAVSMALAPPSLSPPITVLKPREMREVVLREACKEAPLIRELQSASKTSVALKELEEGARLLRKALQEKALAAKLYLLLEGLWKALASMALLRGVLPTSDASELAESLGEAELADLLRRAYVMRNPSEAEHIATLLAEELSRILNRVTEEMRAYAAGHDQVRTS